MADSPEFIPAAALGLDALADLYTRAFADYFYATAVTAPGLARRIPAEDLDLARSPIPCVDGTPAGLALLSLRGDRSSCGGFGITVPFRGRGLAYPLTLELLAEARRAGARRMTLIVLAQNQRAIRTYARAGFRVWRDVLSFTWERVEAVPVVTDAPVIEDAEPSDLLTRFDALHPAAPIWQRDATTLRASAGLAGLALVGEDGPRAYVLIQPRADAAEILDIGARQAEDAAPLLAELQRRYARLRCDCEPSDAPGAAAMRALGFRQTFRRHEMINLLG